MDLNTLISTIISATAALAAIIGGFLVSRVITLSSEKNSIVRRLKEINNEISNKQEILNRMELMLLEDDIDDFIHDHAKEILIHNKPVKSILEDNGSYGLTTEEIEPYITQIQEIFEQTITLIGEIGEDYSIPNNFDDFAKDNAIKVVDNKNWHELVYEIIYDTISAKSASNSLWGLDLNTRLSTRSLMRSVNNVPMQIYRDRIKERNNLRDEVQILTGIKEEQEKLLKDYGKLSGLWGGLAVLIYACIVGIIIPSILLPYPVNTYDDMATKQLLLALFFSELMALFVYLGVSMYQLTKED